MTSHYSFRYHATIDYPYFVSCFKGVVHKDVGITYPIQCTCPYNDTAYIEPKKIPFPGYTIGRFSLDGISNSKSYVRTGCNVRTKVSKI